MGIFSSMDIAGTGLSAQRVRMDVISNNIANANTTRTPDGSAFRRSMAILRPRNDERVYRSPLLPESLQTPGCSGVKVVEIKELGSHHMIIAKVLCTDVDSSYLDEKGNSKFECIVNDSQIPGLPLPGTYQYGRPVTVLNKEDFE